MVIHRHGFSDRFFGAVTNFIDPNIDAELLIESSHLLTYLHSEMAAYKNKRTNISTLYVFFTLVEDYRNKVQNPDDLTRIVEIEPARFTDLISRHRELYDASRHQNHVYNARLDKKFNRIAGLQTDVNVIIRTPLPGNNSITNYQINQEFLIVDIEGTKVNISSAVIAVLNEYMSVLEEISTDFFNEIERFQKDKTNADNFILSCIGDEANALRFEITSFAILYAYYSVKTVYFGKNREAIREIKCQLYRSGRFNANDAGVDFILKPEGKLFQATEEVEIGKWFMDIDKVARYPISFVVKDERKPSDVLQDIREQGERKKWENEKITQMCKSIEYIITIPTLAKILDYCTRNDLLSMILEQMKINMQLEID